MVFNRKPFRSNLDLRGNYVARGRVDLYSSGDVCDCSCFGTSQFARHLSGILPVAEEEGASQREASWKHLNESDILIVRTGGGKRCIGV